MNIGIDLTSVNPSYRGGVNTYTVGLLQGLINVAKNHKIQLFITTHNPHIEKVVVSRFGGLDRLLRAAVFRSAYIGSKSLYKGLMDIVMGYKAKIMDERSDIIYVPTVVLYPYTYQKPTILSMHDIQQVHYPQYFSKKELIVRRIQYELSAERATYLQASSQFIKEDLLNHFNYLHPEQIVVIPEGVMIEEFSSPVENDVVAKYKLPSNFLFFPAQLWFHKNHITVLKALNHLNRKQGLKIPLVMTGAKYTGAGQIFSYIKDQQMDYIYYLGKVPFTTMVALYQRARFFITAVLYESSSLPFLEAAAAGCPIIASDTPPNREMAQILRASLFDPLNDRKLAELLVTIWDDDGLIRDHVDHNRVNIDYYSWDNAARRYLEFIASRIFP
jgi:glycosyltransferase involved in cell wall biosynthesis